MKLPLPLVILFLALPLAAAEKPPAPFVTGLKNPTAVAVGPDGRIYVAQNEGYPDEKSGMGSVVAIDDGKIVPFAKGLDRLSSMAFLQKTLFVADRKKIWKIDPTGKADIFVYPSAFANEPDYLRNMIADSRNGLLFVTCVKHIDSHLNSEIYRIDSKGRADRILESKQFESGQMLIAMAVEGETGLIIGTGTGMRRLNLATGVSEEIPGPTWSEGSVWYEGAVWDNHGQLFVMGHTPFLTSNRYFRSSLSGIARLGKPAVLLHEDLKDAAFCFDPSRKSLLMTSGVEGTLTAFPTLIPGYEVDETPVALKPTIAFPDIAWAGWNKDPDSGVIVPFRPVVLTHAGDGSNRIFVGTEQGVIHAFANDPAVKKSSVFADLQDRVRYNDKTNEEGFLGLAFHPKFKETGEVFVFYTPKSKEKTNYLSRFKVFKNDSAKLDPASEEIVMTFEKHFWNHNGGTICFGPDGYLYVTHGDGGLGNDPFQNGQNLSVLLGKIHRIDVDHKENGKNYAVPKDNPFADPAKFLKPEDVKPVPLHFDGSTFSNGDSRRTARPEIWAYGLRNIWRMSFDRQTGQLWAADVGQNLFEEINLIKKGGNYGWGLREGFHPFGPRGVAANREMIEPIWEYNHDVGKSITGGHVYRGSKFPELQGSYIYGDYVTGKIWALKYDEAKKRVVANRPIPGNVQPIFSWGEDEKGEIYFLTSTTTGKGIIGFGK